MDFVKVLEHIGRISLKSSKPVDWNNPNLIPVSVGTKVICVVYIVYIIFWSKDTEDINSSAMQLRELGVNLEQEDNTAGFLGVTLERDPEIGFLEMKQTGLIK
jgi:hypothetical protein